MSRSATTRALFAKFDADGSGTLSADEFGMGLYELGIDLSDAEYAAMMASADADRSGELDYDEFTAWLVSADGVALKLSAQLTAASAADLQAEDGAPPSWTQRADAPANARAATTKALFEKFDADGSGQLSADELAMGLYELGIDLGDAEFESMMAATDADGSGEVDSAEFTSWLVSADGVALKLAAQLANASAADLLGEEGAPPAWTQRGPAAAKVNGKGKAAGAAGYGGGAAGGGAGEGESKAAAAARAVFEKFDEDQVQHNQS